MDNILLCSNHIPLVTSIHNTFIEKYMLGANGSYVKVYLYLSKCIQAGEEDLSISSLADRMENTEKDIIRAFNYWEKKKLLKITRSEDKSTITGIDLLNPDEPTQTKETEVASSKEKGTSVHTTNLAPKPAIDIPENANTEHADTVNEPISESSQAAEPEMIAVVEMPVKKAPAKQHSFRVTAEQTKRLTSDEEFCWTCNVVESYLERPVKPGELQLISYLYDNLHFSSELILHLYEYCISLGKTSTSYIQTVAISWAEKKVTTPAQAQEASIEYSASYTAISKAFALGRALAMIEKQYVDRWQKEWKMDLSVIIEACNRTMLKIQKADFKYTEGILDNWHKADIRTLQDVEKADELFAKKKAEAGQSPNSKAQNNGARKKNAYSSFIQHNMSSGDMDELEKKLLSL